MDIPFYADSEKLASDNSTNLWIVNILYFGLSLGTFIALLIFDKLESKFLKFFIATVVIGLPCIIFSLGKRNIWRHGDEFLQSLYLKHTAYNGVGFILVLITWQLWGRLTDNSVWDNAAISIAPYLMTLCIFFSVRRDIRKNSEPTS